MVSRSGLPLQHAVLHVHGFWRTGIARIVSGLGDDVERVLVVEVPEPGAHQRSDVADELAHALGHPTTHRGGVKIKAGQRTITALTPSLIGVAPADVVVHRAGWLAPDTLQELIEACAATDARVWLLTEPGMREETAAVVAGWCGDMAWSWSQFFAAWNERAQPAAATALPRRAAGPPFPAVPESNFHHFRFDAQALLSSDALTTVDETFRRAHEYARTSLAWDLSGTWQETDPLNRARSLAADLSHDLALRILQPSLAASVTVLRATQAALLSRGWHLDVDLGAFMAAHARLPTALPTEPDCSGLVEDRDFAGLAAAALLACDIPDQHTWHMTVGDVACDGSAVRVHGRWDPAPLTVRRHLAAARVAREQEGANVNDLLVPWPILPPAPRHLRQATEKLARHSVLVGRHRILGATENDLTTLRRFGLHLARLRPTAPSSPRAGATRTRPAGLAEQLISVDARRRRRLTYNEAYWLWRQLFKPEAPALPRAEEDATLTRLRAADLVDSAAAPSPALIRSCLPEPASAC